MQAFVGQKKEWFFPKGSGKLLKNLGLGSDEL